MKKQLYYSISEVAKMMGLSRTAIYKKVKNGQIKANKFGNHYFIPAESLTEILGRKLSEKDKQIIDAAVEKTFKEYGEVLKRLGST